LEDRKNVGDSSCNSGDGTDQRVQSLMFMMMTMMMMMIIIIIIIIIEFLNSQLWLGNIHLSWDVVINRIRLGGLIYSLESFLQLNMCQELQIFVFVYTYSGASQVFLDFVTNPVSLPAAIIVLSFSPFMSPNFSHRYDRTLSTSFSSMLRGNCPCILFPRHLSLVFFAMLSFILFLSVLLS